jgi:hypothetical protein
MHIIHLKTGKHKTVVIDPIRTEDYKVITKTRYWFNWRTEKENSVYKLRIDGSDAILGLISLVYFEGEERFQINLLAVSKENRGSKKEYEGIAGNLIAYACREILKLHGLSGCVSLEPKTLLKPHYIKKYGMLDAGYQVFLEGPSLLKLLSKYKL